MGTITATWTNQPLALLAPTILARGAVSRTTLDLSTKNGAMITGCIARLGTTAITGNILFKIRRLKLNNTRSVPDTYIEYMAGTAAAGSTLITTAAVGTGVTTFSVTSGGITNMGTTVTAMNYNACWLGVQSSITNATTGFSTNAEWVRVAMATWTATATAGVLTIDAPSAVARVGSEVISNQAEVMGPYWLEGGAKYEIIFDYAGATAGESIGIAIYYETYDTDTTV